MGSQVSAAGAPAGAAPAGDPGATPFPQGDPRNAKYFENLAALEHALSNTLASDQQSLADAQSAYNYSTGELAHQLPLTLQTTRNTANAHGLLESGQLAQAAGSVEAKYAAQRGKLASTLQSDANKINQNEHSAQEAFNLGRVKAANAAREEALKQTEAEAPDEQATKGAPQPPTIVGVHAQRTTGGVRAPRRSGVNAPRGGGGGYNTSRRMGAGQQARRRAAARATKGGGNNVGVG